jgi:hypothetical protein
MPSKRGVWEHRPESAGAFGVRLREVAMSEQASEQASDPASDPQGRLRYRLLTGPDERAFCERVSQALAEGYRLYGSPSVTFDGQRVVAAQAVVLDGPPEAVVRPVAGPVVSEA